MKKLVVLGMGVCLVLAFASCKSSESAYKKAYEKAKQQELAEPQVEAPVEVTPVVAAPVTTTKVADTSGVRQEKVTVVSGNEGLKDYSVVAGSFGVKANAEGLKDWLDGQGYHSTIAFNADKAMYRVIVNSFADKAAAAEAIAAATIIEKTVDEEVTVMFEYPFMNDVMRIVKEEEPEILNQSYDMDCSMTLRIRRSMMSKLRARLEKVETARILDDENIL